VGKTYQTDSQREDKIRVMQDIKNASDLDFVAAWFVKASVFIEGTLIECAFVSTNSITQGEQAPIIWNWLFASGVFINFAHRTFKWENEARGNAAVHCVIIGFSRVNHTEKKIFEYSHIDSDPAVVIVKSINGYLVDATHPFLTKRSSPICSVLKMGYGSKPTDGGHLLFTKEEMSFFILQEPMSVTYFRKYTKNTEFINNQYRYCLWLDNCSPNELRNMPLVLERVKKVKEFRLASTAEPTRKSAGKPTQFFYINQPKTKYLILPGISSSIRAYIPIGFLEQDIIAGDNAWIIADASAYMFGVLISTMHMSWVRVVSGRMKSDYQYSASIVYNNFPWPEPTEKQRADIEVAAQGVLDARARFPDSSLADLYDPNTMPPELAKAHDRLDRLVEKAYGRSFDSDAGRVAFLFERYQRLTGDLFSESGKKTAGKKKKE